MHIALINTLILLGFALPALAAPSFLLKGESVELASRVNGAVLTPAVKPAGLACNLVLRGRGTVSFVAEPGVRFGPGGPQNANTAFYSCKGQPVQTLFPAAGEVRFSWKSQRSLAERAALGFENGRVAFDVFDNAGRRFYFHAKTYGNRLVFIYRANDSPFVTHYIPVGTEDRLFGKNVVLRVRLVWNATSVQLYLNDILTRSTSYTPAPAAIWTPEASFAIDATDVHTYGGGYFASDDIITEFETASASLPPQPQPEPPPPPQPTPTPIPMPAPAAPSAILTSAITSTSVTLSWTAPASGAAVTGYRIYRNGAFYTSSTKPLFTDNGLLPSSLYTYELSAYDASGNESPISAPLTVKTNSATATVHRVGPGSSYATPCQAFAKAAPGDVVEISAAGVYSGDTCAIVARDGLTIRGVNGRPVIYAGGKSAEGKAIWVIRSKNVTIENIEMHGTTVPDRNGAAIRIEGQNMTVRNCYLHHNQSGILVMHGLGGPLLIEYSEFAYNGYGDGQSHNVYVSNVAKLVFRYNYSHHAKEGQLLKTRGLENYILYNRLTSETGGTSSYEIDVSNGGRTFVIGNLLQQNDGGNRTMLIYGIEGTPHPNQDLYVINNTFVSQRAAGATFIYTASKISYPALLMNNIFSGVGSNNVLTTQSNALKIANCYVADPRFTDRNTYDYRLRLGSPCADIGVTPGLAGAFDLGPFYEYQHRAGGHRRERETRIDAGALER